jgi:hypothetical protein
MAKVKGGGQEAVDAELGTPEPMEQGSIGINHRLNAQAQGFKGGSTSGGGGTPESEQDDKRDYTYWR